LEQRFGGVDTFNTTEIQPRQISLSSQHRRFDEALTIAQWLMDNLEAAYADEEVTLPGILFNTEKMFEGFVDAVLDEVEVPWYYTGNDAETHRNLASGTPNQKIYPDHLFRNDERNVLILDSKYTKMGGGTHSHGKKPEREYFYQVLAYGRGYQADTVGLVYPRLTTEDRRWELNTSGYPSEVRVLELDPVEFLSDRNGFLQSVQESLINIVEEDN
jgi:5-methylcytosine-specific restriction endonuclease McrBC regulatory subunit McrC